MDTSLTAALSSTTLALEAIVIIAVVVILVMLFVLNKRKNAPKAPAAASPTAASYYADLANPAQQGAAAAPNGSDPFGGFGTQPQGAPVAAAPAPPPAPVAAPPMAPAPGTPAGWLPDPNGAADTLRYWDGSGWTQHVAARS
jgi:Protein of unknown function (DUF2510)